MVCMYAFSPDPHHQPCKGLVPTKSNPARDAADRICGSDPTQHQGLFVGNLEKTSDPHSPSSPGEDSSVLSRRRRQLSFGDWPAVLSLRRGRGTKVVSSCCTARSIKPRIAALVAQPMGCPTGPCVTVTSVPGGDLAPGAVKEH